MAETWTYLIELSKETTWKATLKLIIDKDYVVYVEDFVSYDFQSFFGEVGGTLGLLLGVSLSHIFEFIGNSLKHGFTKWAQRTKKIATNILN